MRFRLKYPTGLNDLSSRSCKRIHPRCSALELVSSTNGLWSRGNAGTGGDVRRLLSSSQLTICSSVNVKCSSSAFRSCLYSGAATDEKSRTNRLYTLQSPKMERNCVLVIVGFIVWTASIVFIGTDSS